MRKSIIIALGGSIIVSRKIQTHYLARFRDFLQEYLQNDSLRFIIVAGGGSTARNYQKAANFVVKVTDEDKDWLGVHSTRLNAHLLRTIFRKWAYPAVLDNPWKKISKKGLKDCPLFIASGWKPGWSTDYDAIVLANRFGADKTIVATKIPYVYEKDIALHKDARPIRRISWAKYRELIGSKWSPGMKAPVDPVAAEYAQRHKIKVHLTRGTNIKNLRNILEGKPFEGTILM